MIHRGYGLGAGAGLLMLAFFVLALLGIALLVMLVLGPRRTAAPTAPAPVPPPPGYAPPVQALATSPGVSSPARAILDERLARGELTVEEYQRLRAALEGPGTAG